MGSLKKMKFDEVVSIVNNLNKKDKVKLMKLIKVDFKGTGISQEKVTILDLENSARGVWQEDPLESINELRQDREFK